MSTMILSQKNRAATKYAQGYGGRYCACCDHAPSRNARTRRAMKRRERQSWKKEARG